MRKHSTLMAGIAFMLLLACAAIAPPLINSGPSVQYLDASSAPHPQMRDMTWSIHSAAQEARIDAERRWIEPGGIAVAAMALMGMCLLIFTLRPSKEVSARRLVERGKRNRSADTSRRMRVEVGWRPLTA